MKVAIVKYNSGNTFSVGSALSRLDLEPVITNDPDEIASADKVIFPGVGEASSAMSYLREAGLDRVIQNLRSDVLAICLGMQLICTYSEENDSDCLGILPHEVRRFPESVGKVPHVGWNTITDLKSPLFEGVSEGSRVYFVHSYYVDAGRDATASTEYGRSFSSALQHENFYGVQFHPEKSGPVGNRVLENFLNL